ncbi:hypothetical protein D3C87_1594250 [compost metagenome]
MPPELTVDHRGNRPWHQGGAGAVFTVFGKITNQQADRPQVGDGVMDSEDQVALSVAALHDFGAEQLLRLNPDVLAARRQQCIG